MKLIQSLSESRLLASKTAYHRYSARQIAELVYLHVMSLRILASESITQRFARDYATRSVKYLTFAHWYQNATDLHLLIHALVSEDVELKLPEASREFKETLYFDDSQMRRWLRGVGNSHGSETITRALFVQLDGQFRIKDSSAKAIRRLVQDWPRITNSQKQLAMTRLLQMLRVRSPKSDLLPELERLSRELKLELHDVANPETGDKASSPAAKKDAQLFAKLASHVADMTSYHVGKSLTEDELSEDDGGATVAADVVPVVKPLGSVQRRKPKKTK